MQATKYYKEVDLWFHAPFLTSAQDGVNWSGSSSVRFTAGVTSPDVHCVGSWVDPYPVWRLRISETFAIPAEIRTTISQFSKPCASHYTGYVIRLQ
jgi:hypothetical protein